MGNKLRGFEEPNRAYLRGRVLEGDVLHDEVLSFDDRASASKSPRPNH